YGIDEINHGNIKMMCRKRELEFRLNQASIGMENAKREQAFVQGELGKHGCYLEEIQKNSCIG
ncbi:hypothetical protein, partial [Pseudomonas sp.]|uniref:hypothetical protein n=1 Tax=Pseudomonas sp. TaxID=306 RepID=UPI00272BFA01